MQKITIKLQGQQEEIVITTDNFDFEEYRQTLSGEKTDKHGNTLNDVIIGQNSFKTYLIERLSVGKIEEQEV